MIEPKYLFKADSPDPAFDYLINEPLILGTHSRKLFEPVGLKDATIIVDDESQRSVLFLEDIFKSR